MQKPVLFEDRDTHFNKLVGTIEQQYLDLVQNSKTGFVLFSKFESQVLNQFSKKFAELNKNLTQMKRMIKSIIFHNKGVIMDLPSEKYILCLKKFNQTHQNSLEQHNEDLN
mmetsp:Transcript_11987/g.10366  ORF Transcript_11987/g.10366 Transcript_11987/m.10366 type:complete len:111 (+) Transcript_11987:377-709(+)